MAGSHPCWLPRYTAESNCCAVHTVDFFAAWPGGAVAGHVPAAAQYPTTGAAIAAVAATACSCRPAATVHPGCPPHLAGAKTGCSPALNRPAAPTTAPAALHRPPARPAAPAVAPLAANSSGESRGQNPPVYDAELPDQPAR